MTRIGICALPYQDETVVYVNPMCVCVCVSSDLHAASPFCISAPRQPREMGPFILMCGVRFSNPGGGVDESGARSGPYLAKAPLEMRK